jgi:hypothetical protein
MALPVFVRALKSEIDAFSCAGQHGNCWKSPVMTASGSRPAHKAAAPGARRAPLLPGSAADAAFAVRTVERGVFLIREKIGVSVQLADGGEIDVAQQRHDKDEHDAGLHEGKPECRGPKKREAWPHASSR